MTLRTVLMLVCLTGTAVLAQTPPTQSPPAVRSLPVTKVVLYKTGVGYFEHVGPIEGPESIAIQFTNAQLDDVLKSLTTVDLGDGRVTGVSYESPTPMTHRLQALRLPLGEAASSIQVLGALRGAAVDVRASTGATLSGRLLNVERRTRPVAGAPPASVDELSLVTPRGEIVAIELTAGTRVTLTDPDLRRELEEYLNVAGSTRDRDVRRMQIATVGSGARSLFVSYVTEAAVWKTTYRLVFPENDAKPLIQGWAIVDNMSAEDWQDVDLSLVAGAPQAFVQTISQPLFARRPVVPMPAGFVVMPQRHEATMVEGRGTVTGIVRDASGGVLPGVIVTALDAHNVQIKSMPTDGMGEYRLLDLPAGSMTLRFQLPGFRTLVRTVQLGAGASLNVSAALTVGAIEEYVTVTGGTVLTDVQNAARVQRLDRDAIDNIPTGRTVQGLGQLQLGVNLGTPPTGAVRGLSPASNQTRAVDAFTVNAAGGELGDLFEYRLTDPVSIRRNGSALVPILQAPIKAERVSLWNASMGSRPRHAVWMTNNSPLTLDAGTISIVDQGAFAGEGLMETVKPGERRLISYGVDLGVQVKSESAATTSSARLVRVVNGMLTRESQNRAATTYTIRNDNRDGRTLIIEHPARTDWQIDGEMKPTESSAGSHRFRVEVAPHETTLVDVVETQPGVTHIGLASLDATYLSSIVEDDDQREALEAAVEPLFTMRAELARIESERQRRDAEMQSITADQNRVRENMKALERTAEERRLLERYARQLDAQETRIETLAQERESLSQESEAVERKIREFIASLTLEIVL